ncbi:hypothetical protein FRC04_005043 [Tulasnella sp. 424]|nr:hypothetical protein FRC04_005043 [Tulasnella sp. 424]
MRGIGWKEGKLQDPVWMALRASLHFSGNALRWHAELPQDIREDWSKLEVAMITRWPPPDDADRDVPTSTSGAAAPAYPSSAGIDPDSTSGDLKVVLDKFGTTLSLSGSDSEQGNRRSTADISRPSDQGVSSNENDRGSGQLAGHRSTELPSLESGSIESQIKVRQPISGPPKRSFSAFLYFCKDWRDRIRAENSEASPGEVGKLLGLKWKQLPDSEKTTYIERAIKDEARDEGEKESYESSIKQPIFGPPNPGPPKRGLTAFMFFCNDWRDRICAENPGVSFVEVGKLLGTKWQELPDSEKTVSRADPHGSHKIIPLMNIGLQGYIEKANKEKARYEAEKARYEEERARDEGEEESGSGSDIDDVVFTKNPIQYHGVITNA